MAIYMRTGLQAQIWAAWGRGLSMATIARMLPTRPISVYNIIAAQGGIQPPPRHRAARALSVLGARGRDRDRDLLRRRLAFRAYGWQLFRSDPPYDAPLVHLGRPGTHSY
jgi:hypothetical protein